MTLKRVGFTSRMIAEGSSPFPEVSVISITDPGSPPANLKPGWKDVLRLSFHDIDRKVPPYKLFSDADARTIAAWIAETKPSAVLVHCEAGISRSAAVAKALRDFAGLRPFRDYDVALHNRHVYGTLLAELERAAARQESGPQNP